jgi:hypothetical protein
VHIADSYKGITPQDSQTLKMSAVTFVETLNKNAVLYTASLHVTCESRHRVTSLLKTDHVLCSKIDSRPCRLVSNSGK